MSARIGFGGLAVALVLFTLPTARAADEAAIKKATQRGVDALKGLQAANGNWDYKSDIHRVGATSLAALTLLECNVDPQDRSIQKAADAVRRGSLGETHTYSIALAILFLDRLEDPADEPLIQTLTVRLIAGQNSQGGWTYTCPDLGGQDEVRRLTENRKLDSGPERKTKPATDHTPARELPKVIKQQLQRADGAAELQPLGVWLHSGDNSNTQFATIALWVGHRHQVPVDKVLGRIDSRFRNSQAPDGGWSYVLTGRGPMMGSAPAMTCAGLLGLSAAFGSANEAKLRAASKPAKDGRSGKAEPNLREPARDPVIRAGLIALGRVMAQGMPMGIPGGGPQFREGWNGRMPPGATAPDYYFLWSMERVAMILDLKTIGKKDWYTWGSRVILANQAQDGSWSDGRYPEGGVDTCFALLFLRRSNLASDLTSRLKGKVHDPGEVKLVAGGNKERDTPAVREDQAKPDLQEKPTRTSKPRTNRPAEEKTARAPAPKSATPAQPVDAEVERQAAELRDQIVKASGERQDELIEQLKENKGPANTVALAGAIPKLKGKVKEKAREALAQRLARMTYDTLKSKLEADDVEIRRAAALACAVKDDKRFVPILIRLLNDSEAQVWQAVHAALKALTKKDFGPKADATEVERSAAVKKWREWFVKQPDDD